jgi:signal peptidase I
VVYFGLNLSLQNAIVVGRSMEPNLQNNERVLINKLAYRFWGSPKRGDIIVFEPPSQVAADQDYVKRIIGLPGESVVIQNGYVAIILADGTEVRLDESDYLNQPTIGSYHSGVIPEGYYFVLGDNRSNSGDSRQGWLVAKSAIVGKAWLVIWPPSEWGLAPNRKPGVG